MNMFGDNITIVKALEITIISMSIVFFILSILSYVLSLFKFIPQENQKKDDIEKNTEKQDKIVRSIKKEKFDISKIKDEKMLIAMMVATIEASNEEKNSTVRVIGIREIN